MERKQGAIDVDKDVESIENIQCDERDDGKLHCNMEYLEEEDGEVVRKRHNVAPGVDVLKAPSTETTVNEIHDDTIAALQTPDNLACEVGREGDALVLECGKADSAHIDAPDAVIPEQDVDLDLDNMRYVE